MKKRFLTLVLVGALAFSCGQKDQKKDTESLYPEPVENVSEGATASNQSEYTHSLKWTAFKTPDKVGVSGTFNNIELTGVKSDAASFTASLEGAKFAIIPATVNSNDPERDPKLKDAFFAKMKGDITGSFVSFKDGKAVVSITMNGVTTEKTLDYQATESAVNITGTVDIIADFKADAAFSSIHELCKALHAGKTWTDVDIAVEIKK